MDQTLSLYLLETIPLINPESPDYALDVLTLVESILEDPDFVLRKQLDRVKDRKMAEMKAEGVAGQRRKNRRVRERDLRQRNAGGIRRLGEVPPR